MIVRPSSLAIVLSTVLLSMPLILVAQAPAGDPGTPQTAPAPATPAPVDPTAPTQAAPAPPSTPPALPPLTGKSAKSAKSPKPVKVKKEKPPKMYPMTIVQGVLTVDGMVGKARLNYDIPDMKFVYVWAPGVGTVVVSENKFPGAKEEPNAFQGGTLTVNPNGHTIQITSDKPLLGKKPASAWVMVDPNYQYPSAFPVMGYGSTAAVPYAWPAAKSVATKTGVVAAPPLPKSLKPVTSTAPCSSAGSKNAAPCAVPSAPQPPPSN